MSYGNGQDPPEWAPPADALARVDDPADYASLAEVRELYEAFKEVRARRSKAYEAFWSGTFTLQDRLKALRLAVEELLLISEEVIRAHPRGRWYWEGEPPAFDPVTGESACPFETTDDGYVWGEDGKPELRAYRPTDAVPLPDGDEAPAAELVTDGGKYRLNRPILLVGDKTGQPPFGLGLNKLGELEYSDERSIEFIGLESINDCPDPIRIETEQVTRHPQRLQVKETSTEQQQIPENVLMNAYRLCRRFWQREAGLGFNSDDGYGGQFGADPSRGEYGYFDRMKK